MMAVYAFLKGLDRLQHVLGAICRWCFSRFIARGSLPILLLEFVGSPLDPLKQIRIGGTHNP